MTIHLKRIWINSARDEMMLHGDFHNEFGPRQVRRYGEVYDWHDRWVNARPSQWLLAQSAIFTHIRRMKRVFDPIKSKTIVTHQDYPVYRWSTAEAILEAPDDA